MSVIKLIHKTTVPHLSKRQTQRQCLQLAPESVGWKTVYSFGKMLLFTVLFVSVNITCTEVDKLCVDLEHTRQTSQASTIAGHIAHNNTTFIRF
jgi:hypothetical protein